ncbi:MAG: PAS domain S-box protein [Gammaproteobacteria bacterium]|nr:PAS domain S-box protein [Gammaproteobacteria bacterium]MBU1777718.1 PAS domain S-box protein [Gammaproteobacteria bacterium]MBU1969261.1 PAS domain S-box protein [Gammaproteobacteria bacterium]
MDRDYILSILYEMAQVIGGEVSLKPLLTKTLQHLLYNTSFPAGFICLGVPFSPPDAGGMSEVTMDVAMGDYEMIGLVGQRVHLPARLLLGQAERAEDAALLSLLPCKANAYKGYLRLPIDGQGVIVLLAQELPQSELPLTQLFQPVMSRLARAILLCRSYDAYTASLIAARDASQQALASSEEKFKAISAAVLDALIMVDDRGTLVYWNPAAERILGYSADEAVGKPLHQLLTPQRYQERAERGFDAFRESGQGAVVGKTIEIEALHKDGREIPVELSISALKLNERWHAVGILRDISEYKRAEASRVQLAAIVESSSDAIIGKTADGIITSWNKGAERIYGYSAEEALGRPISMLVQPERRAQIRELLQAVGRGESVASLECERIRKDGSTIHVALTLSPIRDDTGNVSGISTIARDITEKKRMEADLQRTVNGLAEAQRIAHLGNWELDLVSNELEWSGEIYRIFEIDPQKFGASYEAFLNAIHPDDRELVNKAYTDSVRDRIPYNIEHRLLMPDGRIKYVNEKCETYYDADGKPLRSVGTVHDITERKLDEEALRRLNRELRAISNCNQTLMRAVNEQALLDDICRIICDDAGYRMAWVGFPEQDEDKRIRPVSWAGAESGYLQNAQISWADTERGRGPSGSAIRSGKSVAIQDFLTDPNAAPWREAATQRGYRSSIALPLKDDAGEVFGILNIYAVQADAFTAEEVRLLEELAGDMAFGIMVLRTRVERQRAEEEIRKLNLELEQRVAERTAQLESANKELEAFSYSVSHDLRSPLRAIDGFSHILLEDYADKLDDEGKRLLHTVRDNTSRMGQLIDDILKFSRSGRTEITYMRIDMENMARTVAAELQAADPASKVQVEIEPLPAIQGDSAMMRQVFVNLISNAIKFSRHSPAPLIHIGANVGENEVVYFVQDNGAGFDMKFVDKLFGVFQRLHSMSEFEGTGIGLAIVKRVIARQGGRVWAEGKVGAGATFFFALPQNGNGESAHDEHV